MSILLTGGAGLYRKPYLRYIFNAGYDVVVADNFCNSKPEAVKRVEEIAGKRCRFTPSTLLTKEHWTNCSKKKTSNRWFICRPQGCGRILRSTVEILPK